MKYTFFAGSNCGGALRGLRVVSFDAATGSFEELSSVDDARDPIFFEQSADGSFLYVAEDVSESAPDAKRPGGVSVYLVARDNSLARIASYALATTVPCHLSLSPDGRFLAWAEYRNANAGVMAVGEDGLLTPLASVHHEGRGPNPVRQEAAHCHFAAFTPDMSRLLVCDLGLDRVFSYELSGGELARRAGEDYVSAPGSGPRHLAFLPGSDLAFLVTELSSEVVSLRLRPGAAPVEICRRSTLPPGGCSVPTKAAAIHFSPAREWLLASNRGHDSIAAFRVDAKTGALEAGPVSGLTGRFPRDFAFVPDGSFAVIGHKLSNEVAAYRFDSRTGALERAGGSLSGMEKPLRFAFAKIGKGGRP